MTKVQPATSPSAASTTSTTTRRLWVAPLVWAAHFLAIYAFTALACARKSATGWYGVDAVPWFVGAATLVAAALLLAMISIAVRDLRRGASPLQPSAFTHWLSAALAGLALLAVVWETLPVLLIPLCS